MFVCLFFPDWENCCFTVIFLKFYYLATFIPPVLVTYMYMVSRHSYSRGRNKLSKEKVGDLGYGGKKTFPRPSKFLEGKLHWANWRVQQANEISQTQLPIFPQTHWLTKADTGSSIKSGIQKKEEQHRALASLYSIDNNLHTINCILCIYSFK